MLCKNTLVTCYKNYFAFYFLLFSHTATMRNFFVLLLITTTLASIVPPFSSEDVTRIKCRKGVDSALLRDPRKVYFCLDNQHMIFHSSSLDTLGAHAHDPLAKEDKIKDLSKKWVEIETNDFTISQDGGMPLTSCLSLENGQTGAISGMFSDSFGTSAKLDLNYALVNYFLLQAGSSFSASLDTSFTMSAEYSCNGKAGQTVQLTMVPSFYRFCEGKYRFLYLSKKNKKDIVVHEDWQLIPDTQVVASAPMLKCVTDPSLLRCDSRISNPWLPAN